MKMSDQNHSPTVKALLERLHSQANTENVAGMARFGINTHNTLGISIYYLRDLAKELGRDHDLAVALWDTGIHEARILAAYIAEPNLVTDEMMEKWAAEIDSWDICDQVCSNLFDAASLGLSKALEWSSRPEEFVKRAGFVIMAALAVHNKQLPDEQFETFLQIIAREAGDPRNFVKKAVNWALRQIGKRNRRLNENAIQTARLIQSQVYRDKKEARAAKWIAKDALRELTSEKVQLRLNR
jgi:3-methyladenine DNA glycosylase AlkD